MATQLLLTKGSLSSLWSDKSIRLDGPVPITDGQIYIGLDNDNPKRAMLFIDNDESRHVLTADIAWEDIRGDVPYVKLVGDTMTGPLSIAREAHTDGQPTPPKVTLDYNDITDSLDFTFS